MALDYSVLEVGLAAASATLALIPTVLCGIAWKETSSNRMMWAMLAFLTFSLRAAGLGLVEILHMSETTHEWIEFGGDLLIITLFIMAFFAPSTTTTLEDLELE